jgi:ATP-dependent DNA ligase
VKNDGAEGLTAAKMAACCWLHPFIVVRVEFLEWTPENRLRHPQFAGIRSDKDAREAVRDDPGLLAVHRRLGR